MNIEFELNPALPTSHLEPLQPLELADLAELEGVIARHVRDFLAVGQALQQIRDSRLYRGTHATFQEYCVARWEFTPQRAGQLIKAFDVETNLETTGLHLENERQARVLAGFALEDQKLLARVVRAVCGEENPGTKKLEAFADSLKKLHNTGSVTNPDTGEELPWDELPEEARMSVLKANVALDTAETIRRDSSLGTWTDTILNYAQTLTLEQKITIDIYRDVHGNVQTRALVLEGDEVVAQGQEKSYLKAAVVSLLHEVKHG